MQKILPRELIALKKLNKPIKALTAAIDDAISIFYQISKVKTDTKFAPKLDFQMLLELLADQMDQ